MRLKFLIFSFVSLAWSVSFAADTCRYTSVRGLVLAGYQGWFNVPQDGAGLGWQHYRKEGRFRPGCCSIDLWPDVAEYEKTYPTDFTLADGTPARVFSSADRSTTMLHFSWMRDYGIDGVFMQRFLTSISSTAGKANADRILLNAMDAAERYDRALCVMYDLSGAGPECAERLMEDWRELAEKHRIATRRNNHYLHHDGRPLVAVWGVGFDDGRRYGLDEAERIVDFLHAAGCAVLVGVPAHWRTLGMDAVRDKRLHEVIAKADIVHPWFVGRFNAASYPRFRELIAEDIAWCREHGKVYMPVVFPGFSWYNLRGGVAAPLDQIPRLNGAFFWQQVCGALLAGAETLYLAMFDEMDEGTALFKCTDRVPVGESPFVSFGACESDRYLWLSGKAAEALRGDLPLSPQMPVRKSEK